MCSPIVGPARVGRMGVTDALPELEKLRDSKDPEWQQLKPFVQVAINRIESGNPDATRMDPSSRRRRTR